MLAVVSLVLVTLLMKDVIDSYEGRDQKTLKRVDVVHEDYRRRVLKQCHRQKVES